MQHPKFTDFNIGDRFRVTNGRGGPFHGPLLDKVDTIIAMHKDTGEIEGESRSGHYTICRHVLPQPEQLKTKKKNHPELFN